MLKVMIILALAAVVVVSGCTSPHPPSPPPAGGDQVQASEDFLDSQSDALIEPEQATEQDLLALS